MRALLTTTAASHGGLVLILIPILMYNISTGQSVREHGLLPFCGPISVCSAKFRTEISPLICNHLTTKT